MNTEWRLVEANNVEGTCAYWERTIGPFWCWLQRATEGGWFLQVEVAKDEYAHRYCFSAVEQNVSQHVPADYSGLKHGDESCWACDWADRMVSAWLIKLAGDV